MKYLIRTALLGVLTFGVIVTSSLIAHAQHLFPQKLEGCNTQMFCLDCGEPQARYDTASFNQIAEKINRNYNLKGASGAVIFQVLVDSVGHGCTLSYTDVSKSRLSQDIISGLNACKWLPAIDEGKPTTSSINVLFTLANDRIVGSIQRVDNKEFISNVSSAGEVKIYNTSYKYTNKNLPSYKFEVWQKSNSALPQDMSQNLAIRDDGDVWYATLGGLTRFKNEVFITLDKSNTPFEADESVHAMAIDKRKNVWISTDDAIYKFDGSTYEKLDSTKVGVNSVYDIIPTDDGELLLCDDKGLFIYNDGNYKTVSRANEPLLPSNRVYYAYRDTKKRLWIGTFSGSIMIDEKHHVTAFNKSQTPLDGICISGAVEDEEGNIYFGLFDYASGNERDRPKEGIAKLDMSGKWTHYNDHNSGLPSNTINSIYYDRFEKLIWLGTNESGLIRFDRKKDWQVYHPENSKVPSTGVYQISQDSKGKLYISTSNGMLRMSKI